MTRNPLYLFLLKAALWLPLCLGLWYWKAEWFNGPAVMTSSWIMQSLFPSWMESVEWSQRILSVATTLKLGTVPGMPEGEYALVLEVNPLTYGFGFPLFVALFLAGSEAIRWRKLALGALLLIPFQAWESVSTFLSKLQSPQGQSYRNKRVSLPGRLRGLL